MDSIKDFEKEWILVQSLVAILFLIMGVAEITQNQNMLFSLLYLLTSAIFGLTVLFVKQGKIKLNFYNPLIMIGFIFAVIGIASNIWLWLGGIIFYITGLFKKSE